MLKYIIRNYITKLETYDIITSTSNTQLKYDFFSRIYI